MIVVVAVEAFSERVTAGVLWEGGHMGVFDGIDGCQNVETSLED